MTSLKSYFDSATRQFGGSDHCSWLFSLPCNKGSPVVILFAQESKRSMCIPTSLTLALALAPVLANEGKQSRYLPLLCGSFKWDSIGNYLVVQWLGLCTFTAEGVGSIPGWGTNILQEAWRGRKKKRKKGWHSCPVPWQEWIPDREWTFTLDLGEKICEQSGSRLTHSPHRTWIRNECLLLSTTELLGSFVTIAKTK